MNVFAWILLAWFVFEIVAQPILVGKPRKPRTGGEAAANSVIIVAWGVLLLLAVTQ